MVSVGAPGPATLVLGPDVKAVAVGSGSSGAMAKAQQRPQSKVSGLPDTLQSARSVSFSVLKTGNAGLA